METTTATVLDAMREAQASGLFYDTDTTAFVAERLGVENTRGLGRECYRAKTTIRDEEAQAKIDRLEQEGYDHLAAFVLQEGDRYTIRTPTLYVGRLVDDYSNPLPVRVKIVQGTAWLIPKGKRNRGIRPAVGILAREGWDA